MTARKPKTAPPHPAFAALEAEAARVGWPTSFRRDLEVHDRAWVTSRDPKAPFMWALREGGTHAWDVSAGRKRDFHGPAFTAISFIGSIASTSHEARFYLWDGVALQAFASAEAARDGLTDFMEHEAERASEAAARFCGSNPATPHEWRGGRCTFCDSPKPTE